jgi:2-C-methyl-D-erythritol 4-phosphate cytidylyltransferase
MSFSSSDHKISLLLLNGGVGSRLALDIPKQFHEVNGHPIMAYTLIAASKIEAISEIVLNTPEGHEARTREILDHYAGGKPVTLVEAGRSRQQSVHRLVEGATNPRVLIHETARPLVTQAMFQVLIDHEADNVGYFDDIPFSMCRVDWKTQTVSKNVRREKVFNIQLPQKFDRATLAAAHKTALKKGVTFTEDAMMVHKMTDAKVHVLPGDPRNIKVTTQNDLITVSQLIQTRRIP